MQFRFVVAIDFDGTIAESINGPPTRVMPGAKEALIKIRKLGGKIILWSGRCNKRMIEHLFDELGINVLAEMTTFIKEHQIPYDEIANESVDAKPFADFFIDDKSIPPFIGDWEAAYAQLETTVNAPGFKSMLDQFRFLRGE